jgi:hypothetical protein
VPILTVAVVVAVAAAAAGIWWPRPATATSCPVAAGSDSASVEAKTTTDAGTYCVGYSAYDPADASSGGSGFVFTSDNQRLAQAQQRVYRENRAAERIAKNSHRQLLTLIDFDQLSGVPGDYASESEDLEGIALAQNLDNARGPNDTAWPLFRVVVANTGPELRDGPHVVDMLTPLIQHQRVVGAIGLDQSRMATVAMIEKLTTLGVPIVSSTLSADKLADYSAMYFQISPPDNAIADMIEKYLDSSPPPFPHRNIAIYDAAKAPDSDDLYIKDTFEDLQRALGGSEWKVEHRSWGNGSASFLGDDNQSICGSYILFFAGRDVDFQAFLEAVNSGCQNTTNVTLMADDSVNRFMASAALRRQTHNSRELIYVAKASLVTCQNFGAETGNGRAGTEFFGAVRDYWDGCGSDTRHPLGERTALAYDAVTLFDNAVNWLLTSVPATDPHIPVTPANQIISTTVWAALQRQSGPIPLTSGVLHWSTPTQSRLGWVDPDKWRSLLHVDAIWNATTGGTDPPTLIFHCGSKSTVSAGVDTTAQCHTDP